jgi:septal ring factor EnvC (AmiA/AmiB activator)
MAFSFMENRMPQDHSDLIHFWQTASMTLFGILTTIGAFWFGIMRHLLKKDDIINLIELHSPYLQERESIMTRLDMAKDMQSQFASALQKNTEVMSELKTQIAVLGKTLENLEARIEKEI